MEGVETNKQTNNNVKKSMIKVTILYTMKTWRKGYYILQ